ncbi:MAG: glycine betaine ABC transporter substrate-binding protein, partial [Planctomycetota bacterium]
RTEEDLRKRLEQFDVRMTRPLGFNNTYAIGMKEELAEELRIRRISDLAAHPNIECGFSDEFMERQDGWPGLQRCYHLKQKRVRGMEHNLAYRGLQKGSIQVTDLYSTDAEIAYYGLRVLEDDRHYFPVYEAVVLYRADLEKRAPSAAVAIKHLQGAIDNETMVELNSKATLDRVPERVVAASFLHDNVDPGIAVPSTDKGEYYRRSVDRFLRNTYQHLFLVAVSLSAAILVAVPLGIVAYKMPALGRAILGAVGVIQTLPSLALLVFMIPLLGLGPWPAIVALFLYSLLPIVRNTYTGLNDIPSSIHESAISLGLPAGARLRLIELPMASRSILAGIKTAGVINVGTATIGALIGAGGYGQPILTGIRLDDVPLILQGAVPAAVMALAVQGVFGLIERRMVPKGLRA